jgi:uncharacterized phage-associated protein
MSSLAFASYISSQRTHYSEIRIHNLLYFANGISLKLRREPLFDEEFVAREEGPVAFHAAKEWASLEEENGVDVLNMSVKKFMNAVLLQFENKDDSFLMALSRQGPWKNTKQQDKINETEMEEYFKTFECSTVEAMIAERDARLLLALKDLRNSHPHLYIQPGTLNEIFLRQLHERNKKQQ